MKNGNLLNDYFDGRVLRIDYSRGKSGEITTYGDLGYEIEMDSDWDIFFINYRNELIFWGPYPDFGDESIREINSIIKNHIVSQERDQKINEIIGE